MKVKVLKIIFRMHIFENVSEFFKKTCIIKKHHQTMYRDKDSALLVSEDIVLLCLSSSYGFLSTSNQ